VTALRQIKQMVARKTGYGLPFEKSVRQIFNRRRMSAPRIRGLDPAPAAQMDDGPHATSKPNGSGGAELRTIIRT
jgi:hypothetical protein